MGATSLYNGYGAPTSTVVSSTTLFNFSGAYFSPLTNGNSSSTYGAAALTVTGYLGGTGGTFQGTKSITMTPGPLTWTQIDLNNVDTLVFTATANSGRFRHFLMDNFTTTPTPIPASVLLLCSGILGLVGFRRLKKR